MFRHLEEYSRIVVTGPQRCGTTIVARAIEYDTGRRYLDEQTFQATDAVKWRKVMRGEYDFVMQAPGMCRFVHEFGDCPDVAVVLVRRRVSDIIASQERIGWQWEDFELQRYGKLPGAGPIATVKYEYWDNYQRHIVKHSFEVDYESLAEHPLWVPADRRKKFKARQWQL
jgi:hypothetical protein